MGEVALDDNHPEMTALLDAIEKLATDLTAARAECAELRRKLDAVVGLFPREGSGEVLVRATMDNGVSLDSANYILAHVNPAFPFHIPRSAIVTLPPERGEKEET